VVVSRGGTQRVGLAITYIVGCEATILLSKICSSEQSDVAGANLVGLSGTRTKNDC